MKTGKPPIIIELLLDVRGLELGVVLRIILLSLFVNEFSLLPRTASMIFAFAFGSSIATSRIARIVALSDSILSISSKSLSIRLIISRYLGDSLSIRSLLCVVAWAAYFRCHVVEVREGQTVRVVL